MEELGQLVDDDALFGVAKAGLAEAVTDAEAAAVDLSIASEPGQGTELASWWTEAPKREA